MAVNAAGNAVALDLTALVWDRQVALGLPAGRDTQIGCGARYRGSGWGFDAYSGVGHEDAVPFLELRAEFSTAGGSADAL